MLSLVRTNAIRVEYVTALIGTPILTLPTKELILKLTYFGAVDNRLGRSVPGSAHLAFRVKSWTLKSREPRQKNLKTNFAGNEF